jgi:hypothetical protein
MTATVIHLAAYRAALRPAAAQACRWSEAVESITASNLRIACAWQRTLLRTWWGL